MIEQKKKKNQTKVLMEKSIFALWFKHNQETPKA
jgi:hypothetical protein